MHLLKRHQFITIHLGWCHYMYVSYVYNVKFFTCVHLVREYGHANPATHI